MIDVMPMTIPRIVKMERVLFVLSPVAAVLRLYVNFITILQISLHFFGR